MPLEEDDAADIGDMEVVQEFQEELTALCEKYEFTGFIYAGRICLGSDGDRLATISSASCTDGQQLNTMLDGIMESAMSAFEGSVQTKLSGRVLH